MNIATHLRRMLAAFAGAGALAAAPLAAQSIETMDPNAFAIDGDLAEQPGDQPVYADQSDVTFSETAPQGVAPDAATVAPEWADPAGGPDAVAVAEAGSSTYGEDDLIGAAEGVFGKGAEGLAKMIQGLLKDQGQPNGYIVGREAGGAFAVGVRYGSGTLHHKIEGDRKVYWTGPSGSISARTPPIPSCWSITSMTAKTSIRASRRGKGRPTWWAASPPVTCARMTWC